MPPHAAPTSVRFAPRPHAVALGAVSLALWSHVQAVEIQGLRALSTLGQPLHAQVTLTDVRTQDLSTLQVRISPSAAYQAASLDRPEALSKANIQIKPGAGQTAVVDISTAQAIQATVLDLLLEVQWANGQAHQQFVVLLDAPGTQSETAATPATTAATASAATPTAPAAAKAIQAPVTVVQGDTLSELMITHRYGVGTMAQRLIATQRANPKAFIRDNVNLVRTGAQLRLPNRADILAIDAQEAQRLIETQMADFDAYRRALAQRARTAQDPTDPRSGQVENAVSGGAQSPQGDRLALTNGQANRQDAALAAEKANSAAKARQGELAENIKALKDLAASLPQAASGKASGSAGTATESGSAATAASTEASDSAKAMPTVNANVAAGQEPQWITQMKAKPWLLPVVGGLLLLLALWVWLRRSQAPKPAESSALNEAAEVANDDHALPALRDEDELPVLDPESSEAQPRELSALLPDVDLDLPDLDAPASTEAEAPPSEATLLEQAKAKLRNGDSEGARALAEEALTSADPMIQDNAKAFLERI